MEVKGENHLWVDGGKVIPYDHLEVYAYLLQWICIKPMVQYYHQDDVVRYCE